MSRTVRLMALPLVFLLGFAGWTGYWLYAQGRMESEIARGVAQLQARGGAFVCEDSAWRGFPLRIALSCGSARLEVPGGPVVEIAALEASGALPNLRHIVARSDRVDFSASGENLTFEDAKMPAVAVAEIAVQGSIEGLPRTPASDFAALLKEAARLGSTVTIERFTAEMEDISLTASGTVALGPEGPTGTLSTKVTNYDALLAELERRGVVSKKAIRASSLLIGLLQGDRKAEGEVTVALRFHEGKVYWGPFAVAEIPPLQ
jgi:hypothetical protein